MRHLIWGIPLIIAVAMVLWIAQFGDTMTDHRAFFAFFMIIVACTMGIIFILEPAPISGPQPHHPKHQHPGDTDPYFDKPHDLYARHRKPVEYRIYRARVAREKAGEHLGEHHA